MEEERLAAAMVELLEQERLATKAKEEARTEAKRQENERLATDTANQAELEQERLAAEEAVEQAASERLKQDPIK